MIQKSFCYRFTALLLSIVLLMTGTPAAWAADGDAIAATGLSINQTTLQLDKGGQQVLTATVLPEDATDHTITWRTGDSKIASVSSDGTVTAVSAGQTSITAKAGGYEAVCAVTVSGVVLRTSSSTMRVGDRDTIEIIRYGNAGTGQYSVYSSNEGVVRIDGSQAAAVSAGNALLRVQAGDYTASYSITVLSNEASAIQKSVDAGQPLSFSDFDDEFESLTRTMTQSTLDYVTNLSVSTSDGILYYNYISAEDPGSGVGSAERYGTSSSDTRRLDLVSFVPHTDFSGSAAIRYTAFAVNGSSFTGTIRVSVSQSSDVTITTSRDNPIAFQSADFSAVCRRQTGRDLDSVTFALPYTRYGVLYYKYIGENRYGSEVEAGISYYRTRPDYLDQVTFVPAEDYTGTVTIRYTGTDTSGKTYNGRITVQVQKNGNSGSAGDIRYSVDSDDFVTFDTDDFNAVCRSETGYSLNYVRFTLPSSSQGVLYYNYRSSGSYDRKASASTSYYRSQSDYLSKVSFVPDEDTSSAVTIRYTGWSVDGDRFTGQVRISINGNSGSAGDIRYSVDSDDFVTFDTDDFNAVCRSETGYSLNYVRFTLPSSSQGVLYYNYRSSGSYDRKASASTSYYRSQSDYLSKVSFVPDEDTSSAVTIRYTGWSVDGDRFTGQVIISVKGIATQPPITQPTSTFTDLGSYSWAAPAIEALYQKGVVTGITNAQYAPAQPINRGAFVLMLCRAFSLPTSGSSSSFSDVPAGSYYAGAIAQAQAQGIALGESGRFYPERALTREDAMVLLQRAMRVNGWSLPDGSRTDLQTYADGQRVSSYAVGAVSALSRLGIIRGDSSSRLNPKNTLSRAELAVILHRALAL